MICSLSFADHWFCTQVCIPGPYVYNLACLLASSLLCFRLSMQNFCFPGALILNCYVYNLIDPFRTTSIESWKQIYSQEITWSIISIFTFVCYFDRVKSSKLISCRQDIKTALLFYSLRFLKHSVWFFFMKITI